MADERAVAAEERVAELEKMIRDFLAMLALRGAPYLFADVCHKYGCPATRIGKRSGPCHCGGSALALKWKGLREAMEATRG